MLAWLYHSVFVVWCSRHDCRGTVCDCRGKWAGHKPNGDHDTNVQVLLFSWICHAWGFWVKRVQGDNGVISCPTYDFLPAQKWDRLIIHVKSNTNLFHSCINLFTVHTGQSFKAINFQTRSRMNTQKRIRRCSRPCIFSWGSLRWRPQWSWTAGPCRPLHFAWHFDSASGT